MIGIIDYGLGNLRSVRAGIEHVGFDCTIVSDPAELSSCAKFILPGVGAFGDGMKNLRQRGLDTALSKLVIDEARPILGICLGAQLMLEEGFEFAHNTGLGWIKGKVIRIETTDPELRIPHVGWNDLRQVKTDPLFREVPHDALVYYVHSYHIVCEEADDVIATCSHGITFTAAFRRKNLFGTQFHPEKSQLHGLQILKNFLSMET